MQHNKYQSLTIKRKLEIIDLVDNAPPGKKKKDIASEAGIPPSTLSTILKNRDVLKASHTFGSSTKKRNRDPSRLDVDAALFQWFTAARAQSVPISGEVLKAKAEELALQLDSTEPWNCSDGWLSRWKNRHTSLTRQFQARMQLLIKRFAMTGRKQFWNHFSTGITQTTFLMQMKRVFFGGFYQTRPMLSEEKLAQEARRAKSV